MVKPQKKQLKYQKILTSSKNLTIDNLLIAIFGNN